MSEHAPEKPAKGQPCNGCGYCCAAEVCDIGLTVCGRDTRPPCPQMRFDGERFRCGFIEASDALGGAYPAALRLFLGIGVGCDAETETEAAR